MAPDENEFDPPALVHKELNKEEKILNHSKRGFFCLFLCVSLCFALLSSLLGGE